jgi:hypothetical protein
MIIWLDTSITAENLKEFDIESKKKLEKIISECKSKPDTVYVDTVKKFITTSLNSYQAGNVMLTQELKNKIIELAKQVDMQIQDITSWPELVSQQESESVPLSDTKSAKDSSIKQINGITRRASIEEFIEAHKNKHQFITFQDLAFN